MKIVENSQNIEEPTGILCASFRDGASALRLITTGGKQWVIPWIHFLYAYHENHIELEHVRLFYSSHEIRIDGVRLQPLVEHLSRFNIEWIKCFDKRYLVLCPHDLPFIQQIRVEEKADK